MPAYSIQAQTASSQQSPNLAKGPVRIVATVSVYWAVGENPVASRTGCAMLAAGKDLVLRMPVKCSRIAVLAVNNPGVVTVIEEFGGARSSCSF